MHITILTIGSPTYSHIKDGVADYIQRLSRYATVRIQHLKETATAKDVRTATKRSTLVLLDEHGIQHTSMSLAKYVEKKTASGEHLTFLIGGANGHTADIRTIPHETIALSNLTFPHELALLILTEALYRAATIRAGHPYHRA